MSKFRSNGKEILVLPKGDTVNFGNLAIMNVGVGKEYRRSNDEEIYNVSLDLRLGQAREKRLLFDDGIHNYIEWRGYSISLVELFPETRVVVVKLDQSAK